MKKILSEQEYRNQIEELDFTGEQFVPVDEGEMYKFGFFIDYGYIIKPGTLEYLNVPDRVEFEEEDKKRVYVKSSDILGSTDLFFVKWNQGMYGTLVFRFQGVKLSDKYSSWSFVLINKPDFYIRMVLFEKVRIFPRAR